MELVFKSVHKISSDSIEKACNSVGLKLTMKTSLKTLPDNDHWHFKKGKLAGVLEITLIIQTNQLILSCKKNRSGEWIEGSIVELCQTLKLVKV